MLRRDFSSLFTRAAGRRMIFRGGRAYGRSRGRSVDQNVVSISVIGVGVAVHTYRRARVLKN